MERQNGYREDNGPLSKRILLPEGTAPTLHPTTLDHGLAHSDIIQILKGIASLGQPSRSSATQESANSPDKK